MSEKPEKPVNSPDIPRLPRVLEPGYNYASVTDKIASIVLTRPVSYGWLAGFSISFVIVMVLLGSIAWLIIRGVGIWGINIPVGWGFAIVNFVWWIGIGHAGTLISAILFLLNQQWRTSINRFAEAMTLFTLAVRGWRFTCSRTQARWEFGRSFAARLSGTCLQSRHTPRFPRSSGLLACF